MRRNTKYQKYWRCRVFLKPGTSTSFKYTLIIEIITFDISKYFRHSSMTVSTNSKRAGDNLNILSFPCNVTIGLVCCCCRLSRCFLSILQRGSQDSPVSHRQACAGDPEENQIWDKNNLKCFQQHEFPSYW